MIRACVSGAWSCWRDAGQRELLARLRAVIEAKDAENAVLRRELDAERERKRRLELRLAELERRLSMDSSDSGTPSSKERIGAKEARRARQQSERERRKDRKRGGQPGHQGKGLATGSGSGREEDRGAAGGVPFLQGGPGRRGGRRAAVGAGHRRGDHPEGDRVAAAGPCCARAAGRSRSRRRRRARIRARCPTGRC